MGLLLSAILTFSKNSFRMSKSLNVGPDPPSVGPDLDPNCLQWLSQMSPLARKDLMVIYLLTG